MAVTWRWGQKTENRGAHATGRPGNRGRQGDPPAGLACADACISGFTLVELTIVILIVGILLAFSLPQIGDLTGHNLKASCRRLSGTIKYVFHRATVKRTIYRLNFDLKTNEYWITYQGEDREFVGDATSLGRKAKLPRNVAFEDIAILGRGTFREAQAHTHFFPKGWVEETLIHLKDTRGRQASVHILPLSARIRIHDGYVEPAS